MEDQHKSSIDQYEINKSSQDEYEINLSLCFDKWKKCTTFATVKVVKIGCTRCKTLKQVLRFTRWHNLCQRKSLQNTRVCLDRH